MSKTTSKQRAIGLEHEKTRLDTLLQRQFVTTIYSYISAIDKFHHRDHILLRLRYWKTNTLSHTPGQPHPTRYLVCHTPLANQTRWTRNAWTNQEERNASVLEQWHGTKRAGNIDGHAHWGPKRIEMAKRDYWLVYKMLRDILNFHMNFISGWHKF